MDPKPVIGVVSPLEQHSGNRSTILRVQGLLQNNGVTCFLYDNVSLKQMLDSQRKSEQRRLNAWILENNINVLVALHAYRAGQLLGEETPVPYVVVFGGTDLSLYCNEAESLTVMGKCVENAFSLIAFSDAMKKSAFDLWPQYAYKLQVIPQSVDIKIIPKKGDGMQYIAALATMTNSPLANDKSLEWNDSCVLLVLPAGLRPVKDVLHVATAVSQWSCECENKVRLLIIGSDKLDKDYAATVREKVNSLPGVYVLPPVDQQTLHSIISDAFLLLNTSKSEGMCSSILEAMALRTPVIVRDIPGNAAIVKHGVSGILYTSPEDFVREAKELLKDEKRRGLLVENASALTSSVYDTKKEYESYARVLRYAAAS
eukprot:m.55159 g.55159  ORF g.55159 m.55159 type:complete len:372 (+) comp10971_c0_seq1:134-1249(+)